ncbi:ATP diphosphatase [Orbus hercynius]|uniref:Nucleoside triphosphate pyrophosphohydrolase n=1 Tax=Orbus hercynius TaxID=593135 RepID=A0A495RIN7_9GAMM|nr:nucleoside triphosphate pyrophosphohydrolase [Orbus hercynius]RKS87170.1 ATP diphosphatase [Orbus hercynius]
MQSIEKLFNIMTKLRDPVSGCEWDRVQTFDSIKGHTLEECYEVLHAIEQRDFVELKNELGDLLFQIIFYAEMAKEQQYFTFDDICDGLAQKLTRRHPHIFAEQPTAKVQSANAQWEVLKQQERIAKQQFSILDDIPLALPALMRAEKMQKRCASVGFDWQSLPPVIDKIKEELVEVQVELSQQPMQLDRVEEEIGDLLFSVVNLTRHMGFKAELTLHKASQKFEQRFRQIEDYFAQQHRPLNEVSLDEMEQAWQDIKSNESQNNLV